MEIELPPAVILGVKVVSGFVAVVMLLRSRRDIPKFWNWVRPKKTQAYRVRPNMDAAWRQLIDDSRHRSCEKSIKLLNEWMAIRTHAGLIRKLPKKTP